MCNTQDNLRRGGSLVEILVVLAVLVIGIFGVARLYPAGFGNIRYTERTAVARSMARANEDYFRARAANLPDAIVAIDQRTGAINPTLDPTVLFTENNFASGAGLTSVPDPRYSGPNRWRHVLGEVVRIPPPSNSVSTPYATNGPVSLYYLTMGPMYSEDPITGAGQGNQSNGIEVYSATPQKRVIFADPPQDADDVAVLQGDQDSYGICYDNNFLYFPITQGGPRIFRLQLTYVITTATGQIRRITPAPVSITVPPPGQPAGSNTWIEVNLNSVAPPPLAASSWQVARDSDTLYRQFTKLAPNSAFSASDPYQFVVLNRFLGLVGFSPLGASIPNAHFGGRGLVAKIDYDVDDWHILRQDLVVPSSGPPVVKLPGAPVKRIGDVEDTINLVMNGQTVAGNNNEYGAPDNAGTPTSGLMRNYPGRSVNSPTFSLAGIDVVVVDLSDGVIIDSTSLQGSGGAINNGTINYRTGVIEFAPNVQWNFNGTYQAAQPIAGKNIRVFYRAEADWGVSVEKAAAAYLEESGGIANLGIGSPFGRFFQGTAQTNNDFLFFSPSELGKSVMVDYTWQAIPCGGSASDAVTHTEVGELHQLMPSDDPLNLSGVTGFPWMRTAKHFTTGTGDLPVPGPCGGANGPAEGFVGGSVRILGIRGASFTSRVFWREGLRWARVDQDAVLVRSTR